MTHIADDITSHDPAHYELSVADRCDSCGAQAYVRVTLASGDLYFCGHHATRFREKLAGTAIAWHDESERLLADAAV